MNNVQDWSERYRLSDGWSIITENGTMCMNFVNGNPYSVGDMAPINKKFLRTDDEFAPITDSDRDEILFHIIYQILVRHPHLVIKFREMIEYVYKE